MSTFDWCSFGILLFGDPSDRQREELQHALGLYWAGSLDWETL